MSASAGGVSSRPPIISSTGVISTSSALALVSHSASKALAPVIPDSRTRRVLKTTWPFVWRIGFVAAIVWTAVLLWRRRKRRARQKTVERSYQLFGTAVRFGLDIGGTLSKVVYFEPEITNTPAQSMLKARVSAFIRRSHSYGVTGRRDSDLEVSLHPIRGTLHFLKFQTSMMPNFICIVRENELSPQRPLKEGGGSDDLEDGDSAQQQAARRNNHNGNHQFHHHVHSHTQLPVHPSMIARSYSAAWRSEDEFRQQYLNALHPLPQGSATPQVLSESTERRQFPAPLEEREGEGEPAHTPHYDASSTDGSTSDQGDPSEIPVSHSAEPVLQSANSTSTATGDDSPDGGRACTITPRPMVPAIDPATVASSADTVPAGSTGPVSSRGATPSSDVSNSISCPSSPLAGVTRQPSHDRSSTRGHHLAPSASTASSTSSSLPPSDSSSSPVVQGTSHSFDPFLHALPPKRLIQPTPAPSGPVPPSVCATGGGAFKFEKLFRDELHITLHKEDELRALVKGIDFMIHSCADECYFLSQYRFRSPIQKSIYPSSSISYPYLVVNIGSGVSILKVSGPSSFERVGGTSLGGGTFYGLTRALTGCTSFEEALSMAEQGRSGTADLLVGDIYGGDYDGIGLSADTVAASFGKLVRGDALKDVRKEDLAKAALVMITNNIGSLANLYARKVLNVPQMIFVGNFLNSNDIAKRGLAFATEYWSKGQAKALFLTHEGYFGAVGSLLGDA